MIPSRPSEIPHVLRREVMARRVLAALGLLALISFMTSMRNRVGRRDHERRAKQQPNGKARLIMLQVEKMFPAGFGSSAPTPVFVLLLAASTIATAQMPGQKAPGPPPEQIEQTSHGIRATAGSEAPRNHRVFRLGDSRRCNSRALRSCLAAPVDARHAAILRRGAVHVRAGCESRQLIELASLR